MSQLVLFDLDGTLADTAPDLGLALNIQRQCHGLPELDQAVIRPYASHGSKGLLGIGFGLTPADEDFNAMREEYLALYDEVFVTAPSLFNGMGEVLAEIEQSGLRWGVVTNKPRRFSEPLIAALNLEQRLACLVCADDVSLPKPYPDSMLMACERGGVKPDACIYIGDAERDIQAGHAAGMPTVVALYGYLDEADRPLEWGADYAVDSPLEIIPALSCWRSLIAERSLI
ncbi:HAD-IA family hydrolase [Methylobacillus caricis]|uniref:HAD family hydrolase n=1 Tax=Methylobacillus caricis TaxID=1971611 RepID=UPI001CFFAEC0|nr:HAD-IA family hydrolase [Methylobacillus caricis]MCB5187624.1 HAD-IA family hydrolase [Methylobacillus caricis]